MKGAKGHLRDTTHVSGHACQEGDQADLRVSTPEICDPVPTAEYRHRMAQKELAISWNPEGGML